MYQEPGLKSRQLLTKLHLQEIAYVGWKQVQDSGEECRNIVCMCRGDVGKVKAQLQLWLGRDIKSNKSNYCCIGTKSLNKENVDSVLIRWVTVAADRRGWDAHHFLLPQCSLVTLVQGRRLQFGLVGNQIGKRTNFMIRLREWWLKCTLQVMEELLQRSILGPLFNTFITFT